MRSSSTVTIPGYEIFSRIHESRNSLVYRGQRLSDGQLVVIKLLRREYPTLTELARFHNQYTIAKTLNLENIEQPLALETYGNSLVLVMADDRSVSLKTYIGNYTLKVDTFLGIAIQLAQILEGLFAHGVIHRDIKPQNLLIHPETGRVKLIDFSLAVALSQGQNGQSSNRLEGTIAYIAPEQTGRINCSIDHRTDFYALGATCYELLTRQLPFLSEDASELVHCHLAQAPVPPHLVDPAIPLVLSAIILKLMAKTPEERYQSATGLRRDLENCLHQWQASGQILPFPLDAQAASSFSTLQPPPAISQPAPAEQLQTAQLLLERCTCEYFKGQALSSLALNLQRCAGLWAELNQEATELHLLHQTVLNLLGESAQPTQLIGEHFHVDSMIPVLEQQGNRRLLSRIHVMQLMLSSLFDNPAEAVAIADRGRAYLDADVDPRLAIEFYSHDALARLAIYADVDVSTQTQWLQTVNDDQAQIRHAQAQDAQAQASPEHCFWLPLIEAERYRVMGDYISAMVEYDRAIAQASAFPKAAAIANELAAKFYLAWEREKIAQTYFTDAYYAYARWGAIAKVGDLARRYPTLLTPLMLAQMQSQPNPSTATTAVTTASEVITLTSSVSAASLDLTAVIKAAQALSGQVQLEQLLSTLIQVMLETAGAEKCTLILPPASEAAECQLDHWRVAAVGDRSSFAHLAVPLHDYLDLPFSILQSVQQNRQTIVIEDARKTDLNVVDEYIQNVHPRSILCIPAINQGKLVGVLYLENNLIPGAFGADRVEILKLLCTQAAIALENAQLYARLEEYSCTLEQRVAERTQQLQEETHRSQTAQAVAQASLLELVEWQDRYQAAGRASGQMLYEWNAATNRSRWGPNTEEILGYTAAEMPQNLEEWVELIHPADRAAFLKAIEQFTLNGKPLCEEYRIHRKDGIYIYVLDRNSKFVDGVGKAVRVVGLIWDMTARKRAEVALQRSEAGLRQAQRIAHLGIWELDIATQTVTRSEELLRIYGWDLKPPQSADAEVVRLLHPDDRETLYSALQKAIDHGLPYDLEYRIVRDDGQVRLLLARGEAIADRAGQAIKLLGTVMDITERKQIEQELKDSKTFLDKVLNTARDPIFVKDEQHRWVLVNDAFCEFVNFTAKEILGKSDHDLFPEAQANVFWEKDDLAINSSTEVLNEELATHADGTVRILETKRISFQDASGKRFLVGNIRDITDRIRIEEALRQSELRNRAILEAMPDLMLRVQRDGTCLDCFYPKNANPGYFVLAQNYLSEVLPEVALQRELEAIDGALTTGELQVYEQQIDKLGKLSYEEVRVVAAGKDEALIIIRDITERKLAQEAQQDLLDILESTTDIIAMVNRQGQILYLNQAGRRFAKLTETEDLTRVSADDYYPQWVKDKLKAEILPAAIAHGSWVGETALLKRSGEEIPTSQVLVVHRNSDGSIKFFSTIMRDISDRKQAELELRQAKRAAESANRAKSEFLANMSHELRTPLNAILGFTQLLSRDRSLSAEHGKQLEIILQSSEHLLGLINNILEMSKIEAGRMTLDETRFDLYSLLDNLEEMLRLKAVLKGLQFDFKRAADVPQFIQADQGKLRQILLNLLSNAVKFTQTGGVMLRVGAERQPGEAIKLYFEVEDTGIGIAASELHELFNTFVQTAAGRRSQQGTGLGLAISQQFAHMMGGDITVSSRLGQGSIFRVHLLVQPASTADAQLQPALGQITALAASQPTSRILVAEDHPANRQLVVQLLTRVGFEVQQAANGQEAIALWQRWSPDLILMDMHMPVLNGYQATQQIKALPAGQTTVIIALTASVFEEQRAQILAAGCNDFIYKPFDADHLLQTIGSHLNVQYTYAAVDAAESAEDGAAAIQPLQTIDLSHLPEHWRSALYESATQLDSQDCLRLIAQLPSGAALLARTLVDLLDEFRFDIIAELVQPESVQAESGFER
ncbi:PAS domain S-box protein [Phormidium tenue FACHB-886]|nr:PAS domain S-box protein [Phormidium tenue FACHB-886]